MSDKIIQFNIKTVNDYNCSIECSHLENPVKDELWCGLFHESIEWKKLDGDPTAGIVRCKKCLEATHVPSPYPEDMPAVKGVCFDCTTFVPHLERGYKCAVRGTCPGLWLRDKHPEFFDKDTAHHHSYCAWCGCIIETGIHQPGCPNRKNERYG